MKLDHKRIVAELPLKIVLEKSMLSGGSEDSFHRTATSRHSCVSLRTFGIHGTKCKCCGLKGNRVIAWRDAGGSVHVDLFYHDSVKDTFTLMNRDHIIPKSKRGRNSVWNYQTMCQPCNTKKGNNETHKDILLNEFRKVWERTHTSMEETARVILYDFLSPKLFLSKKTIRKIKNFKDKHMFKLSYLVAFLKHSVNER